MEKAEGKEVENTKNTKHEAHKTRVVQHSLLEKAEGKEVKAQNSDFEFKCSGDLL